MLGLTGRISTGRPLGARHPLSPVIEWQQSRLEALPHVDA